MDEHVRRPSGSLRLEVAAPLPGGVAGLGTEAEPSREVPPPRSRRGRGRHRHRHRHRRRRWPVLLVGLVFLFTPAAAYVSGVRATEIENRRLTSFPSVSSGWSFFPQLSAWATDHLPLRDRAVAANTRLSESVFGEPPQYGEPSEGGVTDPVAPASERAQVGEQVFQKILLGEDGWLFLGADVSGACQPKRPVDETLAGLSRFGDILRRAGKTYVFTVAPDKSTMNPDKMPRSYVGDDCAPAAKAAFWQRMQDDPPVGYVDLKRELARVQEESGERLWRPSDTHWAQRGALVYVQEVAEALDPSLWRTSRITPTGPIQVPADLAAQLGTPRKDTVPGWLLERDGVSVVEESATALAATTVGAPIYGPRTLILGDSFTQSSRPALAQLFASARIAHPAGAVADPTSVVLALTEADTVVLEIVERSVVGGDVPIIDPAFLAQLDAALNAA